MSAMKARVIFWGFYKFYSFLGIERADDIDERDYSLL